MKISVIIPVYNKRELLQHNLYCLIHQSMLPDELVISDDGSTEDIPELVHDMKNDMPFSVKYIHQDDQGFRAARCRNNGVRAATGDLLMFLDQDIVYTKNLLKLFADNLRQGEFLVAYPVRLSQQQTSQLTEEMLREGNFNALLTPEQKKKIISQYKDEKRHRFLFKLKLRPFGPKLRSIAFAVYRNDFEKVNGFDENFRGWGNEDDDLGRRFHRAGIIGRNIFYDEYPVHQYHQPHHQNGERVNRSYNRKRKREIRAGDYRCPNGLENPADQDASPVMEIK